MSKLDFDKNFIIGISAGVIGILFYDLLQTWYRFYVGTISFDEFNEQIPPMAFAGITIMLFVLIYAKIVRKKEKQS